MKGEEEKGGEGRVVLVVVFLVIFFSVAGFLYFPFGNTEGWAHSHKYNLGDEVLLWVNKVGPFQNPQETYPFYSLPFCQPEKIIESTHEGLGEALQGYELIKSNIEIHFRVPEENKVICTVPLSEDDAKKFTRAITNHYWYQLFFDDLPIWGMVGESYRDKDQGGENVKPFIYSHKKFSISWNGDRVIEVNLTSENPVAVAPGAAIKFTYSVNWVETDTRFDDRFNKYLDKSFFQHQIHWFSIFNSSMMVIFLVCVVLMILMRTLKRDAKIERDEYDGSVADDSGWKQIPGDVFRSPSYLSLFSALVGTGHQLTVLVFSVLLLAILGTYYSERGTVVTAFIICYSLTSFIAGYGGGGYYARNGGTKWIKTMILTSTIFPSICFSIAFLLNFIALSYKSLNYIPFSTMVVVLAIWIFIACPLTLIGTVVGKNWNGRSAQQKRVRQVPRPIPDKPWYSHRLVHIILGGVLPFGSIFIEMYFIFTSFYKYYYVYGFMLLVYVILIIVTVCVTIVSTYFLLNGEDYRWQWTSFLSAASTAGYVFLYAVYYYFVKTKMSGFFQTIFYFGYMAMFCSGLALLCGAVGFIGTSIFVHEIYSMIKST